MKVIKATKKPVTIECMEWIGTAQSTRRVLEFMGQNVTTNCSKSSDAFLDYHEHCLNFGLTIETPKGDMKASVNDFIIKGVSGEFYPCKPDIFHKTYDVENNQKA
jgi:hypothetical protein